MSAWLDLIGGVVERGRAMVDLRRAAARGDAEAVVELCERLLGAIGEASGTAVADEALGLYRALEPRPRSGDLAARHADGAGDLMHAATP